MVKHIEDIAIDKSREYRRNYIKSKFKYYLRRLFPLYYDWKLSQDIDKYIKEHPDERQEL